MAAPLPRPVKALGLVSLLTDASSEMITPLLPAFLTGTLRAGPAFLGLVEGVAESAATVFKVLSGYLSDRLGRRKPLIVAGYSLSSLSRPLVALATAPWHVLAVRFADRVGKGTRGAPRDALLAEVTPPSDHGRAFGFHRALDHAGAMLGPLLAAGVLLFHDDLRMVFALAAVPALASVALLVFGVKEPEGPASRPLRDPQQPPADAPPRGRFRAYLGVLAAFALGNSSDAFLLLRAQELGVSVALLPVLWTFHHLVKSTTSTAGGALSDRVGRRATILSGWGVYAATYAGLAVARTPVHAFALFALYGIFHALTEGPERALVADLAGGTRGRAFGLYHAVTGGMLLPASLLTGALWQSFGAATALLTSAALAGLAAGGFLLAVPTPGRSPSRQ